MIYVPGEVLVRQMLATGAASILSAYERHCATLPKPGCRYPRPARAPVHETEVQFIRGAPLVGFQEQFDHLDYSQGLVMGDNRAGRQIGQSYVRREPGSIAGERQGAERVAYQRVCGDGSIWMPGE